MAADSLSVADLVQWEAFSQGRTKGNMEQRIGPCQPSFASCAIGSNWCVPLAVILYKAPSFGLAAFASIVADTVACVQDINEAISRLPQDVQMERNMRLKRAMDLSLKHVYLDKEMQEKQTPFNHYLQGTLEEVKNEQMERYMVGAERTYDRSLP
ncbi:unnamed protein product [Ostreobium quekettii]|uniref:Uncharacterized protein n=1 Tax=Ostreobium quekettii TaxID=121088 RepID=A0A8S1ISV4_9CHLO|nr:unnamed protein product [Ostreobium quekettii]